MSNSIDPDQMLHSAASDLGLHCLQWPSCPNILGYYGILSNSMILFVCLFVCVEVLRPSQPHGVMSSVVDPVSGQKTECVI